MNCILMGTKWSILNKVFIKKDVKKIDNKRHTLQNIFYAILILLTLNIQTTLII